MNIETCTSYFFETQLNLFFFTHVSTCIPRCLTPQICYLHYLLLQNLNKNSRNIQCCNVDCLSEDSYFLAEPHKKTAGTRNNFSAHTHTAQHKYDGIKPA